MPDYIALSSTNHRDARWNKSTVLSFARNETFLPLVAAEITPAVHSLPIAFIDSDNRHQLVAVTSLTPGVNLFITTDGQWLGDYVPVGLRVYPFRLLSVKDRVENVLCFDRESGLVGEDVKGDRLFNHDGTAATQLTEIIGLLKQIETSRIVTDRAIAALSEARVIQPWSLTVKNQDADRQIKGLKRIDEARLIDLGDETFLALRHSGALPIAYAQLLAMPNINGFQRLVQLRDQLTRAKVAQKNEPAMPFLSEDHGLIF